MLYDEFYVITSKISITVGCWTKINCWPKKTSSLPPPLLLPLPCCLGLCSWHSVHRHSGGHSAKIGWQRGGLDRGDDGACCKPNRGYLVHRITFSVCFAAQNPLFWPCFANLGQCSERITLATLSPIEQMLAGVYELRMVQSWPPGVIGLRDLTRTLYRIFS